MTSSFVEWRGQKSEVGAMKPGKEVSEDVYIDCFLEESLVNRTRGVGWELEDMGLDCEQFVSAVRGSDLVGG